MPFNLLLFPILGGYYVIVRSEFFRYEQQRVDRQKLVFNSILAGIVLLCISWLLTALVTYCFPDKVDWMRDHYPLKQSYFGTAFCSFLLGVFLTEIRTSSIAARYLFLKVISLRNICSSCWKKRPAV